MGHEPQTQWLVAGSVAPRLPLRAKGLSTSPNKNRPVAGGNWAGLVPSKASDRQNPQRIFANPLRKEQANANAARDTQTTPDGLGSSDNVAAGLSNLLNRHAGSRVPEKPPLRCFIDYAQARNNERP
jgi:hypothetical protein